MIGMTNEQLDKLLEIRTENYARAIRRAKAQKITELAFKIWSKRKCALTVTEAIEQAEDFMKNAEKYINDKEQEQ